MLRWYCVNTRPRGEEQAQFNLENQGYPTLLPLTQKLVKREIVDFPLFPGYLFVQFDTHASRWRTIHSTLGVRKLLSAGPEYPLPVPDRAIADMLSERSAIVATPQFKIGMRVRIVDGPFLNYTGICEMVEADRVKVLLSLFGRPVSALVSVGNVVKEGDE